MEPLLPYTYIPKADFLSFKQAALLKLGTRGLICSHIDCYFEKPCNETLPDLPDLALEVELYYGFANIVKTNLSIRGERLLTPGQILRKPEQRCYLAVFAQATLDQHTWYLGSQTMADYYTVFDMTPMDELHKDFIQVGFAKRSPTGLKRQQHSHKVISEPKFGTAGSHAQPQEQASGGTQPAPMFLIVLSLTILLVTVVLLLVVCRRKRRSRREAAERCEGTTA